MKNLLNLIASIALFLVSLFFIFAVVYLVRSEVMPALGNGSFTIDTKTMVLNRVWVGNEIYMLLAAYTLLAVAFAYGGFCFAKIVIRR